MKRRPVRVRSGRPREFSAASGRGLIEAPAGPPRLAPGGTSAFPRHRAAASLKPPAEPGDGPGLACFPRHRAAASLKLNNQLILSENRGKFSAASGRGLIEADAGLRAPAGAGHGAFSAASGRGLIEARRFPTRRPAGRTFSAASGRGLIEARRSPACRRGRTSFPRHRAAASLKLGLELALERDDLLFSAASGRGLIEATNTWCSTGSPWPVFRGIGPRPH